MEEKISQIYRVQGYFKIYGNSNFKDWNKFDYDGFYFSEDGSTASKNKIDVNNMSWKDFYDYVCSKSYLTGIYTTKTLFKKRPIIVIRDYYRGKDLYFKENSFYSISLIEKYTKSTVSLDWINKHLTTSQAIKYLKDRGMNICPLGKE